VDSEKNNVERSVDGINYNTKLAKITLHSAIDRQGIAAEVFGALGQHGLNVELISAHSVGRGRADIQFAVLESDIEKVTKVVEVMQDSLGVRQMSIDHECALITVYGSMLSSTPGIAGNIFARLTERNINIEMISASMSSMNILVKRAQVMDAVEALRSEFNV
jgi:aspartate kinase